jgi:hypothetical protein
MNGIMKAAIWISGMVIGGGSGAAVFMAGLSQSKPPATPTRAGVVSQTSKPVALTNAEAAPKEVLPAKSLSSEETSATSKFNAEVFEPPSNCRAGAGSKNAVKEVLQRGNVLVDRANPQTDDKGTAWYREQYLGCWIHHSQLRFKSEAVGIDNQRESPNVSATLPPTKSNVGKHARDAVTKERFLIEANATYREETGSDPDGHLNDGFLMVGDLYCDAVSQADSPEKAIADTIAFLKWKQKAGIISKAESKTLQPIFASSVIAAQKHLCPSP